MKRAFLFIMCSALLLSGCGQRRSELSQPQSEERAAVYDKEKPHTEVSADIRQEYHSLAEERAFVPSDKVFEYHGMDSFTAEMLKEVALSDSNSYIPDLAGQELLSEGVSGTVHVMIPQNGDYTAEVQRLLDGTLYEGGEDYVSEICAETEDYIAVYTTYTELRSTIINNVPTEMHIERGYLDIFIKDLSKTPESIEYTGEMTADSITAAFDILVLTERPLCRASDETESAFIYSVYLYEISGGDFGLCDMAYLIKRSYTINKATGRVEILESRLMETEISDIN